MEFRPCFTAGGGQTHKASGTNFDPDGVDRITTVLLCVVRTRQVCCPAICGGAGGIAEESQVYLPCAAGIRLCDISGPGTNVFTPIHAGLR